MISDELPSIIFFFGERKKEGKNIAVQKLTLNDISIFIQLILKKRLDISYLD